MIYKYELRSQTLSLPLGTQILDIKEVNGTFYFWAALGSGIPQDYIIYRIGTGWTTGPTINDVYMGTTIDSPYVWHWFYRKEDYE